VEIARRSLAAEQQAIEVTQNNIANAHTEGYSRQRPVLAATNPYRLSILNQGQLGSGVEIKEVQRLRDIFLDRQLRANLTEVGFWEGQDNELAKVEALFTEPAQNSVNDLLAAFWNSWQELSNHPQEASVRISVTQTAVNLTTRLNYLAVQLNIAREEITENLNFKVTKLNELAAQLAEINKSIAKGLVKENHALMDQRDLILDQMARLAEIDNVVAVKESTGDMEQCSLLNSLLPADVAVFSGDDSLTLPMMALGARGVVSIVSHILGNEIKAMIDAFVTGNVEQARELHIKLFPAFKGLFITTNPIPLKAALNLMGMEVGGVRLPLIEADDAQVESMRALLKSYNLIA